MKLQPQTLPNPKALTLARIAEGKEVSKEAPTLNGFWYTEVTEVDL